MEGAVDGNPCVSQETVDMGEYEYRSIFRISQIVTMPSGEIQLLWNSRRGENHTILTCTDIMTGTLVGVETVASGGLSTTWTHFHMPAKRQLFYRVDVAPPHMSSGKEPSRRHEGLRCEGCELPRPLVRNWQQVLSAETCKTLPLGSVTITPFTTATHNSI
jgi:hypothetical protein